MEGVQDVIADARFNSQSCASGRTGSLAPTFPDLQRTSGPGGRTLLTARSFYFSSRRFAQRPGGPRIQSVWSRGLKRQGDIGEFDLAAAGDLDHHWGRFDGERRGAAIKRKRWPYPLLEIHSQSE